jgi:hypothetical protein
VRFAVLLRPRPGSAFDKHLARLLRKHPSLLADLATAWAELIGPPPVPIPCGQRVVVMQRTAPHVVLKVRVASSDMGKGASGGFRVVLLERQPDQWQPILIYPKNEQEDISPTELRRALRDETEAAEPEPEPSTAPDEDPPAAPAAENPGPEAEPAAPRQPEEG